MKSMNNPQKYFSLLIGLAFLLSCGNDANDDNMDDPTVGDADISVLASAFYNDPTVTFDIGDNIVTIKSSNEPDHKSMYYPNNHALYENYDEPNNSDFIKNPNSIVEQNYEFKIPRYPMEATNKTSTSFDAIGVSVNGVVFFNQNAAPGNDILNELNTFDQYEGHPQNQGSYHYHIEPLWLTETLGSDKLIGVLIDGFPVYGPVENGQTLANSELDEYHGHFGSTLEFADGIYHYHVTAALPWVNGGEYFGTPGTWTN